MMELSRVEVWHVLNIMLAHGTGHCEECKKIEKKLIAEFPLKVADMDVEAAKTAKNGQEESER